MVEASAGGGGRGVAPRVAAEVVGGGEVARVETKEPAKAGGGGIT